MTNLKKTKKPVIVLLIILLVVAAGAAIVFYIAHQKAENPSSIEPGKFTEPIYSKLSGLEISSKQLDSSPTYCIQIPNGSTDGARPQVGLNQAAIVFEAIAETGITRFAAVFQNPTASVIGPIRSLRPYYLEWDTPFDCTVVHDGGSQEALQAIASGGQRNLDEDFRYMWRDNTASRLWNNVFTSTDKLNNFAQDYNYTSSNPQTFPRLTPEEAALIVSENLQTSDDSDHTEKTYSYASNISINFGQFASYNTFYIYDPGSNSYRRKYQTGDAHEVYDCPVGLTEPDIASECHLTELSPNVIVAMMVRETTMSDNYHEDIKTIGTGKAYIFQNGQVIEGKWLKRSEKDQLIFKNNDGEEVSFAPGQVWIAATPQFGSVDWETVTSTEHYQLEER